MIQLLNRLSDGEVAEMFEENGAVIRDSHFVYTSGKHGPHFVNKDKIGLNPLLTSHLAFELAHRIRESVNLDQVVAVVGAPMGAIRLSEQVAYWLNTICPRSDGVIFSSIYADKEGDSLVLKRGFPKVFNSVDGLGAVLIEDIVNTGKSAKQLCDAVRLACGEPTVLGVLCNRGEQTAESIRVPVFKPLMKLDFEAFTVDQMPVWLIDRPVRTDLGHGVKWLASFA